MLSTQRIQKCESVGINSCCFGFLAKASHVAMMTLDISYQPSLYKYVLPSYQKKQQTNQVFHIKNNYKCCLVSSFNSHLVALGRICYDTFHGPLAPAAAAPGGCPVGPVVVCRSFVDLSLSCRCIICSVMCIKTGRPPGYAHWARGSPSKIHTRITTVLHRSCTNDQSCIFHLVKETLASSLSSLHFPQFRRWTSLKGMAGTNH